MLNVSERAAQSLDAVLDVTADVVAAQKDCNPDASRATFARTAIFFGSLAYGTFKVASRLDTEAILKRALLKPSLRVLGLGFSALTCLDTVATAGFDISRQTPQDPLLSASEAQLSSMAHVMSGGGVLHDLLGTEAPPQNLSE